MKKFYFNDENESKQKEKTNNNNQDNELTAGDPNIPEVSYNDDDSENIPIMMEPKIPILSDDEYDVRRL